MPSRFVGLIDFLVRILSNVGDSDVPVLWTPCFVQPENPSDGLAGPCPFGIPFATGEPS